MAEKSELTDYLLYGVDLKERRIYFGVTLDIEEPTDVTTASVELAVRALHRMAQDAPNKPIEIHMNSYGGDVYSMMRFYDEILACPCQVKFIGGGAIMSAASFIMAVCDERNLHPHATVMVHELSSWSDGRNTDMQIDAGENKRLMDVMCDIYEKNSRMPKEFWHDILQRDLFLSAGEAVSLGLADKVIEPKKRGNLRKARQNALKKTPSNGDMRKLINDIYARLNKVKVPKIELNEIMKEPADPHIFVDDKPAEKKEAQLPVVAEPPKDEPKAPVSS